VRPELLEAHGFRAHGLRGDSAGAVTAAFCFVTRGSCAIELASAHRTILLGSGDGIVLPRGVGYRIGHLQTDSSVPAQVLSGRLVFETSHHHLVLSALPEAIVMSAAQGADPARMCQLMRTMVEELHRPRDGARAIANDLATALLIMVVRAHLEREGADSGLLGLLAHRQASLAVAAMLENLGRAWKLDELAACAHASRASLVRMFRKQVRQAPLEFLLGLRMEVARRKLATTQAPLGDVAAAIGYHSESAFSRAFRRHFGIPPGEARHCERLADGPKAPSAPAVMPRRGTLISNALQPSIAA
jgi:AraC family transcriptional activator of mtrCDE